MKNLRVTPFLFMLILLISCGEEDVEPLKSKTISVSSTITWHNEGVNFTNSYILQPVATGLELIVSDSLTGRSLSVISSMFRVDNGLETYNLRTDLNSELTIWDKSSNRYSSFCDESMIATLTITNVDTVNSLVSGTFEGSCCIYSDDVVSEVTNGVFTNLTYVK